jgi:hypothetical protein
MHSTANPYPNVPFPAGAVKVYDWHDTEYGIDHAGRYFRGFTRVVDRDDDKDISVLVDGTQRPDGRSVRIITLIDGNTGALGSLTPGLARQIAAGLVAAADEVESSIEIEWNRQS